LYVVEYNKPKPATLETFKEVGPETSFEKNRGYLSRTTEVIEYLPDAVEGIELTDSVESPESVRS
jgi:hypothetical protein